MEFKFSLDVSEIQKTLADQLQRAHASIGGTAKAKITESICNFFNNKKDNFWDGKTQTWITETTKGDGLKQIEEFIADKFLDERFQKHIEQYFDDNWEKIFHECMVRAMQHKANGIAFNKVHTLPPLTSEVKNV